MNKIFLSVDRLHYENNYQISIKMENMWSTAKLLA